MTRMSAKRLVMLVLLAGLVTGCAATRTPPKFRDVPPAKSAWTEGRRLWSEGRTLHVAIDDDPQGLYVSRIEYEAYDGHLYLATVRQSRPFADAKFEIDTTGLKLNQPWQDHVYWVADVRWDDVTCRAATVGSTLGQRVDRVKAEVTTAPPDPVARRID